MVFYGTLPPTHQTPIQQKSNYFLGKIQFPEPGTGPIGFVSKFRAVLWYLCVRNSDMDPDRTKIDFGTPLPNKIQSMFEFSWETLNKYMIWP